MNQKSTPLVVFLITLFILSCLNTGFRIAHSGSAIVSDGLRYYAQLRSLAIDKDVDFYNELKNHNPLNHSVGDLSKKTPKGLVENRHTIGVAILWAPLFLLAHLLTFLAIAIGFKLDPNGYSLIYQFVISAGSALYAISGIYIIYKTLGLYYSQRISTIAACAVAAGTNVIYYTAVEATMSHAMSLWSVSLFVYLVLANRNNQATRVVVIIGMVSALMVLVRPQNALFIPLCFIWLISKDASTGRLMARFTKTHIKQSFIYMTVLIVCLVPQLIFWKALYGQYLVYSYGEVGFDFGNPHLLDSLFSWERGLISWTPLILLCLVGVFVGVRKRCLISSAFLLLFLCQWYVNSAWSVWTFGHSFGLRAYINCSVVFAFGLSTFLSEFYPHQKYINVALVLLVLWNLSFVTQFSLGYYHPEAPVTWKEVSIGTFTLVQDIGKKLLY